MASTAPAVSMPSIDSKSTTKLILTQANPKETVTHMNLDRCSASDL